MHSRLVHTALEQYLVEKQKFSHTYSSNYFDTAAAIIEVAPPLFLKPHKKQEASGLPAYMASGRLVYHNNAFSLTG